MFITVTFDPRHTFMPRGVLGPKLEKKITHSFPVGAFDQVVALQVVIWQVWSIPPEDQKLSYTSARRNQIMYPAQMLSNFDFTFLCFGRARVTGRW